jgi:D-methionine transport system ATP-binding protein
VGGLLEGTRKAVAEVIAGDDDSAGTTIRVRGLSKVFEDTSQRVHALNELNLEVKRRSIHGVLGASGAGKTTLLRCILRLEKPDAGSIIVDGRDWAELSEDSLHRERHKIGVVFQHLHLLASRTVRDNVALPLEFSGVVKRRRDARVRELLDWFGISEKADEYPARLSGGQRQRVALARALATEPHILLADEPTSALDTETKDSVLNVLLRIREELGITILLITHDLHAARTVCDVLSVLDKGRIAESGLSEQMITQPTSDAAKRLFANVFV